MLYLDLDFSLTLIASGLSLRFAAISKTHALGLRALRETSLVDAASASDRVVTCCAHSRPLPPKGPRCVSFSPIACLYNDDHSISLPCACSSASSCQPFFVAH